VLQENAKTQKLQKKIELLKIQMKERILTEEEKEMHRPGTRRLLLTVGGKRCLHACASHASPCLADEQTGPAFRVTDRKWDPALPADEPPNWETSSEWQEALDKLEGEIHEIGFVGDHGPEIQDLTVEIEALRSQIPELQDRTNNRDQQVQELKAKWLDGTDDMTGLRGMVEVMNTYFSATMEKQGIVGEVELYEAKDEHGADDFKNFGLR
jgi:chromosome segregation ATPase